MRNFDIFSLSRDVAPSSLAKSSASPKYSDNFVSPITVSPSINHASALSPIKGVGIGSTWSATLGDFMNLHPNTSAKASTVMEAKEVLKGSPISKSNGLKTSGMNVTSRVVLDRQNLSPDLVFYILKFLVFIF